MSAPTAPPATRERPILFSAPMVRAILAGRKTQTRRVIRDDWWRCLDPEDADDRAQAVAQCPYGAPGDALWVRETWRACVAHSCGINVCDCADVIVRYEADGAEAFHRDADIPADWAIPQAAQRGNAVPAIHMPRWASRISLRVTGVRVERLQEISEADAIAEGLVQWSDPPRVSTVHYGLEHADVWETDPRNAFARGWDSINGKRAPWASNPYVWVVSFERIAAQAEGGVT